MQNTDAIQKMWLKLLSQAMENEAAIGRLYARYAELFPRQSETWSILAQAEKRHTASLQGLLEEENAGVEAIPLEKLQAGVLEFVTGQITVMTEKAVAGDVTEARAAANALLLESELAESFLFNAASTEDSPFRRVAEQLCHESQQHRQIILGLASEAPADPPPPLWKAETVIAPPEAPSRIAAALAKQTAIASMVRHEETVARLYTEYAGLFPDMAEFWNTLADDEKRHAAALRQIGQRIEAGELDFSAERFSLEAIRASTAFIESQLAVARHDPVSKALALSTAQAAEEKSIEYQTFHVFTEASAPIELRIMFSELQNQELRHRAAVTQKLAEEAAGPGKKSFLGRLFGRK
jgi:rubrerythrin